MKQKPEQFLRNALKESLDLQKRFFESYSAQVLSFAVALQECFQEGKQVLIFGNGGSAADAQHLSAELMHRVENVPLGLRALALHTDTSLLTALANDEGYDRIYAKQIEVLAHPGDLAVAISTSGNSTNIVEALKAAKRKKCRTVGLLGRDGGTAARFCDIALVVEHGSTPRIQEVHGMILHFVCQLLEQTLPVETLEQPQTRFREPKRGA